MYTYVFLRLRARPKAERVQNGTIRQRHEQYIAQAQNQWDAVLNECVAHDFSSHWVNTGGYLDAFFA